MRLEKEFAYDVHAVGGVAYDGDRLWVSLVGREAPELVRIDPETGTIERRFTNPAVRTGVAWDGEHVWQCSREGIECLDPETGAVLRRLPVPDEGFISGLTWDGEALWVGARDKRRMYRIDPESGAVLRMVETERYVTGIAWVGEDLWHAVAPEADGELPAELWQLDAHSGGVVAKHRVSHGGWISGLAHDGERFWCGDCVQAALRAVRI